MLKTIWLSDKNISAVLAGRLHFLIFPVGVPTGYDLVRSSPGFSPIFIPDVKKSEKVRKGTPCIYGKPGTLLVASEPFEIIDCRTVTYVADGSVKRFAKPLFAKVVHGIQELQLLPDIAVRIVLRNMHVSCCRFSEIPVTAMECSDVFNDGWETRFGNSDMMQPTQNPWVFVVEVERVVCP